MIRSVSVVLQIMLQAILVSLRASTTAHGDRFISQAPYMCETLDLDCVHMLSFDTVDALATEMDSLS